MKFQLIIKHQVLNFQTKHKVTSPIQNYKDKGVSIATKGITT